MTRRECLEIGLRIKASRESLCMTQEQLAELVNISRTHLSNLEQGKNTISLDLLMRIAKHLRTSPADLLPRTESSALNPLSVLFEKISILAPRELILVTELMETTIDIVHKHKI